jgi:Zn-dependent M28 family amino/carboxypeptidase
MQNGYIWNGADDNASGTVGVMTIAKACMATGVKPKRSIVFAAWTGEEKGLLGSEYFADHPFKPVENISLYLNLDMISRGSENDSLGNKCSLTYTNSVPFIKELAEKYNEEFGFQLDISYQGSEKPRGGSDHSSFSAKDVPVMYYFTGFHEDYHGIGDHANRANLDKMEKIIKLCFLKVWDVANLDHSLNQGNEKPQ